MKRQEERDVHEEAAPVQNQEKRPYEPPKVESVRLSKEAAESLT